MIALDVAAGPSERRQPSRGPWMTELRATLVLAAPLILTNLAQHGLVTADVVLLGRLGAEPLAAGALATSLYFILFICGIGLASVVSPLIAGAVGRGDSADHDVRRIVAAGLWAVTIAIVPVMLALWHTEDMLLAMGQQPKLAEDAGLYMRALQWSMWPALAFMALRASLSALERPGWPLAISLAALPVNVGLAIWLAFEGPGLLGLGMVGVGLATTLAAFLSLAALAAVMMLAPGLRQRRLFLGLWRPNAARLATTFRLGLPMAATGLAEASLFEAAVLGMGLFGTAPLAAHAVTIQIAAICFMVPNGIGQAATVRVGRAFGAEDRTAMRRAGTIAILLGFGFMSACALVQVTLPRALIGLFLDLDAPGNAEVIPYAVTFIGFAALFAMADGVQSVALGALRGMQDTRVPMAIALFGYWVIGIPAGILAAWGLGFGGAGIWMGFCAGLAVVAVMLVRRWRSLSGTAVLRP
ncbi:MATE family efflux transporter [Methylobacterium sp. 77]|uniref:MATE family efflux transporter n=1 Tax=Methylobacterium sp. 77 TaxID=1101192 RepID=UPI00035F2198|nr:MATE family efflux transporter [Methylobacterium sp. 77]